MRAVREPQRQTPGGGRWESAALAPAQPSQGSRALSATRANDAGTAANDKVRSRHEALLQQLEAIVLAEGFSGLTVAEIAARLRCSRRTLYELAPSKDELVLAVLERFFARVREQGDRNAAACERPEERVFEYLKVAVPAAQRISRTLVCEIDEWEPSRRVWRRHLRLRVEGLRQLVEEGIAAGVFKHVHAYLVAETTFAAISRLREPEFYANANITLAQAFEQYYAMLLDALRRPAD